MAVRHTYLALKEDHQLVVDWFSALPDEVTVDERDDRILIYFRAMAIGPLPLDTEINQEKTPFVFIEKPQRRLGTLWTNSEVYFSPTPLKQQFPALQKISHAFGKWLHQFELVFKQKDAEKFDLKYYLEAGIQNYSDEVYALPHALAALRAGQYFVSHRASAPQLNTLAKALRLRGYQTESENHGAQPAATDNDPQLPVI